VRHRQVLAVVAVASAVLSGCADRPNDLDTYYDDPTTTTTTTTAAPAVAPPPVVRSDPPPSTTSKPVSPLVRTVAQAVLTDADLAEEGVSPGEAKVSNCLPMLRVDEPDEQLAQDGSWRYPTGSSLEQRVVAYPGKGAAAVVQAVKCAGQAVTLPAVAGIDAQRGWCEGSTCTVLLAKGELVSGVQVTANTAARASEAAKRLAKIAAAKLKAAQLP
jgi:hypothetical protein